MPLPTLEELYEEYEQGLEEYLEENGFDCYQCCAELNEIKKTKEALKQENKHMKTTGTVWTGGRGYPAPIENKTKVRN